MKLTESQLEKIITESILDARQDFRQQARIYLAKKLGDMDDIIVDEANRTAGHEVCYEVMKLLNTIVEKLEEGSI